MAGDFRPPERVKNALDNRKLSMSVPCPGAQGKWSSLQWGLYANNPRITVFTNDPNDTGADKGYGKISANLDLPVFAAFLCELDKIIMGPEDVKVGIENKNFIFPGGKRSEKPVVVSTLWFGKNKEGEVWMSVVARDRPKIQFKFGAGQDFHHFVRGDGTPYSAGEWSQLCAKGYIRILEEMMPALAVANYVEPPKKDPPAGGGGYGGGQRGGGGGGNYGGGGGGQRGGSNGGGNSGGGADSFGGDGDDLPF